jgi:hypothetical protein
LQTSVCVGLSHGQDGLGSISAEIRGLQQQSAALSLQLNNRKAAQVGAASKLSRS